MVNYAQTYTQTYTHHPPSTKPSKSLKLWDALQTLSIINTSPGYNALTCTGHAPSQHRRCRNPINAHNRTYILHTLDEISYLEPNNPIVLKKLQSIAAPSLCVRWHRDQASLVLEQWKEKLQMLRVPKMEVRGSVKPVGRVKEEPIENLSFKDLLKELRELRECLAGMQADLNSQRPKDEPRSDTAVKDELLADNWTTAQEERIAKRREQLARERAEKERLEIERREQERLERERKAREKQEHERLEKERKVQEEKERRRREDEARNERIKQRAQKRREDEERSKREKEEAEKREWEGLWMKYQERWTRFKADGPGDKLLRDAIPWPVKSGSYEDVKLNDPSEVVEFLQKAVPKDSKTLRKECGRWHPDMISRVPGFDKLTELQRKKIDMICRKVTDLLNAHSGRSSECL